jgi:hypothetical protein
VSEDDEPGRARAVEAGQVPHEPIVLVVGLIDAWIIVSTTTVVMSITSSTVKVMVVTIIMTISTTPTPTTPRPPPPTRCRTSG